MKKMLLLLNPKSGQRKANRYLPDIIRLFCANGYKCETYVTGGPGDGTRYLNEAEDEYDLIVCIGGDGTLNDTVAGMMQSGKKCPIGYIPAGTTNDFAATLGLSGDIMRAARDIISGKSATFDVGVFNGRYFIYTASCGAFAKASYSTSQTAKNMFGHAAYVVEGLKDLASIRPLKMHIEADDRVIDEDIVFCTITNSTSVGGILKLNSQLVALNDGKFEVTLVKSPTNPSQLSRIIYGLTVQDIPNEMIYFFSASKIGITCENPIEWTLDGERASAEESVQMENLRGAVRMILPERRDTTTAAGILPDTDDEYDDED